MTFAVCTAASLCWLGPFTHLAWIDGRSSHHGRTYVHVERWVHGTAPLPDEVPTGPAPPPGAPPPVPVEDPRLLVLRFAGGEWTPVAEVAATEAQRVIEFANKVSVAGSVAEVTICGLERSAVTLIVELEGREVRRSTTSSRTVEFLGLPAGNYMLRAEAPGYRQVEAASLRVDRCGSAAVRLERYGWQEWMGERIAPAVSLVKAAWMLAGEYIK